MTTQYKRLLHNKYINDINQNTSSNEFSSNFNFNFIQDQRQLLYQHIITKIRGEINTKPIPDNILNFISEQVNNFNPESEKDITFATEYWNILIKIILQKNEL